MKWDFVDCGVENIKLMTAALKLHTLFWPLCPFCCFSPQNIVTSLHTIYKQYFRFCLLDCHNFFFLSSCPGLTQFWIYCVLSLVIFIVFWDDGIMLLFFSFFSVSLGPSKWNLLLLYYTDDANVKTIWVSFGADNLHDRHNSICLTLACLIPLRFEIHFWNPCRGMH